VPKPSVLIVVLALSSRGLLTQLAGDTAASAIAIPSLPFTVSASTALFGDHYVENCPRSPAGGSGT
jgi:hypothetical protein